MTTQKFRLIADDLRDRILDGALTAGVYLPSHEDLARDYDTTRNTVRRALEELTREGYLVSRQPQGVMVRDTNRVRLHVGEGFAPPFPNLADRLLTALAGDRRMTKTIDVSHRSALPGIALRLSTDGALVVLRRQVISAGGRRLAIENTFIPKRVAAGSALEHPDADLDVTATLADMGLRVVEHAEELLVRLATAEESREMWWPVVTPVLVQMRTGYAADDLPVMCVVQVLPGDTWVVVERHPSDATIRMQAVS